MWTSYSIPGTPSFLINNVVYHIECSLITTNTIHIYCMFLYCVYSSFSSLINIEMLLASRMWNITIYFVLYHCGRRPLPILVFSVLAELTGDFHLLLLVGGCVVCWTFVVALFPILLFYSVLLVFYGLLFFSVVLVFYGDGLHYIVDI